MHCTSFFKNKKTLYDLKYQNVYTLAKCLVRKSFIQILKTTTISMQWCWLIHTVACPCCRVQKEAVSAGTFIAPFEIWTQLVTGWCWCRTLIYILTLRLIDKLEPRVTRTFVPSVRIGAILITWSFETFVYVYDITIYTVYTWLY